MTNARSTKRAFLTAVMALVLSFTMLLGTTFAWFTDSVVSSNNVIKSGNLDITLEYYDGTWKDVTGASDILTGDRWEPGYVDVAYFRIKNAGSLALKYQFGVNIVSEKVGKNTAGEDLTLSDYIYFDVEELTVSDTAPFAPYADRKAAMDSVDTPTLISAGYSHAGSLEKDSGYVYLAMVVYMPESVGNAANHDGTNLPEIDLGVNVYATQYTKESDSFDDQYDADAKITLPAASIDEFIELLNSGNNVDLETPFTIDQDFINAVNAYNAASALPSSVRVEGNNIIIDGNGASVNRTEKTMNASLFTVAAGYTVTFEDITLDGGASWSGNTAGGSHNTGMSTGGSLVASTGNGIIVLNEGTVLQNNDGASAVSLATRGGGSLTLNSAQIINNRAAGGGAIWGGSNIVINGDSKINGNHATSIGGAIRMVNGYNNITFTMNGGEMNYNTSDGNGGAIWGGNSATYVFNGGEMAHNSAVAGGAIWTGTYEKYTFEDGFELHDNSATALGGAVRFCDHASLTMNGGKVYGNTLNGQSNAFYLNNNSTVITGGEILDDFSYSGGLGLTVGKADIDGVIAFSLSTNHNTAYLAKDFNAFSFTVNESAANFASFNFKPEEGYVYTEGDEAKLICQNDGYVTYWDEATSTFRLKVDQ